MILPRSMLYAQVLVASMIESRDGWVIFTDDIVLFLVSIWVIKDDSFRDFGHNWDHWN